MLFANLLRGCPIPLRRTTPKLKPETIEARKQKKRLATANLFAPEYTGQNLPGDWYSNRRIKSIGVVAEDLLNLNPGSKPIPAEQLREFANYMRQKADYMYWRNRTYIQMQNAYSEAQKEVSEFVNSSLPQKLREEINAEKYAFDFRLQEHKAPETHMKEQFAMLLPEELQQRKKLKRQFAKAISQK